MKANRSAFPAPEVEFIPLPSCDMIRTSAGVGSGIDVDGDNLNLKPIPIPRS